MDVFQFHILLGLLPKYISYGLITWLFNTHIIPRLEDCLKPTTFQRKFPILDDFDEQSLELYNIILGIYIEAAKESENIIEQDEKERIMTACVLLSSIVHMLGILTHVLDDMKGVADPAISGNIQSILGYEDKQALVRFMLNKLQELCEMNQFDLDPYIKESHRLRHGH